MSLGTMFTLGLLGRVLRTDLTGGEDVRWGFGEDVRLGIGRMLSSKGCRLEFGDNVGLGVVK